MSLTTKNNFTTKKLKMNQQIKNTLINFIL